MLCLTTQNESLMMAIEGAALRERDCEGLKLLVGVSEPEVLRVRDTVGVVHGEAEAEGVLVGEALRHSEAVLEGVPVGEALRHSEALLLAVGAGDAVRRGEAELHAVVLCVVERHSEALLLTVEVGVADRQGEAELHAVVVGEAVPQAETVLLGLAVPCTMLPEGVWLMLREVLPVRQAVAVLLGEANKLRAAQANK